MQSTGYETIPSHGHVHKAVSHMAVSHMALSLWALGDLNLNPNLTILPHWSCDPDPDPTTGPGLHHRPKVCYDPQGSLIGDGPGISAGRGLRMCP